MNFVLEYLLLLSLLLFLVDDTKGYWGGGKDDPGKYIIISTVIFGEGVRVFRP